MAAQPSRLTPLARRARCTEGQLYTMVIGLAFAVLLVWSGLPAAFHDVTPPLIGATAAETTTTTEAPSTPTSLVDLVTDPSSRYYDPDSPLLDGTPEPTDATAPADTPGTPPDAPAEEATPAVCDSQAALDLTGELLRTLDALGVIPEPSVTLLLANLTGCKQGDPVILVMGVLAELGSRLPDPGFDLPLVPIPGQDLPPGLVALAQPLRDAIDPICGAVGSISQLAFYGLAGWPLAIDRLALQALQQVLFVCGQLQI